MNDDRDVVPLSALEHHVYCARQAALIHVDGLWNDNAHTVRGTVGHQRADHGPSRRERGRLVLRAVPVWSERLGLTGRCDTVEAHGSGAIVPVEYKIGTRHGRAADIQLCAQALCLEEMAGAAVDHGFVWYSAHRRRDRVGFDAELRRATLAAVEDVRCALRTRVLPAAPADQRCRSCQLVATCLPEIVSDDQRLLRYLQERFR